MDGDMMLFPALKVRFIAVRGLVQETWVVESPDYSGCTRFERSRHMERAGIELLEMYDVVITITRGTERLQRSLCDV